MRKLKKYEQYQDFLTNNPDWWENTFTDGKFIIDNAYYRDLLKSLVYAWFRYRRLNSHSEEVFSHYFEREIRNIFDRWIELTKAEALRQSDAVFNDIFVYNVNDYNDATKNINTANRTVSDTGTITDQGADNRTLNTQIESDYTGTQSRQNTGTQTSVVDGEIKDTGTQSTQNTRNLTDETEYDTQRDNTGTQKNENTGTQTTNNTGTQTTNNTGTQTTQGNSSENTSNTSDTRGLATALPQSITANDGEFETHFDGVDGEPNPVENFQAGWHTAGSKEETKGTNSGVRSGTETGTRTDNLQSQRTDNLASQRTDNLTSQRTDNLTETKTGTDTTTRTGTENGTRTDNLKRENDETTTRTDNLNETQTRNLKDLTKNTGTDNLAKSNTRTNNLSQLTTGTLTDEGTKQGNNKGRTNHNPYEIIKDSMNTIITFCSTEWLVKNLNTCFLQLWMLDDFEEDWEYE